ncbi:hypothetical protein RFI_15898, partial [Reticulomyxa filosa]
MSPDKTGSTKKILNKTDEDHKHEAHPKGTHVKEESAEEKEEEEEDDDESDARDHNNNNNNDNDNDDEEDNKWPMVFLENDIYSHLPSSQHKDLVLLLKILTRLK